MKKYIYSMFLPKLNISKFIILFIYIFIAFIYFFYFSQYPEIDIINNKYANEFPIINIINETEIAPEDFGAKMDTFLINFKDLHLKYHIKNDETINCKNKILLIIIPSRPENFKARMDIRNSWLADSPSTAIHRFIIAKSDNKYVRESNRNESAKFKDLIITDFIDNYKNLPLKIHAAFHWQQHYCPNVNYLLKTDDDSVVNIERLFYWIRKDFDFVSNENSMKTLFCRVLEGEMPSRDPKSKWYIPEYAWPHKYFPDYCNGPSYLLTSAAVKLILQQTPNFFYITVEDVFFTGILAQAAKIQRIQRRRILGVRDKINPSYFGCDENEVPYITSTYHINPERFETFKEKANLINATFESLKRMECPNYFLSLFYWIFR